MRPVIEKTQITMENNDVLRSIRYSLNLTHAKIAEILALAGLEVPTTLIADWLKKEDEPDYKKCSDRMMSYFLNGLIFYKRGKNDSLPAPDIESKMTNNLILKKLRIAFELKESDLLDIYQSVDFRLSKPELTAIFRKPGHKNYRACGDQLVRYFLKGLAARLRPSA